MHATDRDSPTVRSQMPKPQGATRDDTERGMVGRTRLQGDVVAVLEEMPSLAYELASQHRTQRGRSFVILTSDGVQRLLKRWARV